MVSRQATLFRYPDEYFPETYLVIDIETTGFKPATNYITQFGMAYVVNREVEDRIGFLLQIPPGSMSEGAAEVTGLSEEICNRDGMSREQAIPEIRKTLMSWIEGRPDPVLVGHNVQRFDIPFIQNEFEKMQLPKLDLSKCKVVDTGAIAKAEQIGTYPLQDHDETMWEFTSRIMDYRIKGVKWKLETYCVERFNLHEKLAADEGIRAHDASSDCVMTHLVLEAARQEREAQQSHA